MPNQTDLFSDDNYCNFLSDLKQRIRSSQIKAALAVNQELIRLYWQIGNEILNQQREQGWGSKVIQRLAKDLKKEFPDIAGFSLTNLKYMRAFAEAYSQDEIGQRSVDQLPWRHNIALLTKLKDPESRFWYVQQTLDNGWSRDVLVMQIESQLYQRQGKAITNFERALPSPQSDLAQQLIKSPYNFDFLTLGKDAQERELERGLIEHIRDFLLELGVGFAFIGSQYPIVVDEKEYRIDLLFYHTRLHAYVILELKMGEFEPSFSGQMNFYVSAVNHTIRTESDNPTIGIILCRSKSRTTVEFALDTVQNPIGVSTYRLQNDLPEELQDNLPTVEQLEIELESAAKALEKQQDQSDQQPK